jgi:hypothetical protein
MIVIVESSSAFVIIGWGLGIVGDFSVLSVAAVADEEAEHKTKHYRANYYAN